MEQNAKSKRFSLLTQNASSSNTVSSNAQSSAQLLHCEVTLFKEKMLPSAVTRNSKDFFSIMVEVAKKKDIKTNANKKRR